MSTSGSFHIRSCSFMCWVSSGIWNHADISSLQLEIAPPFKEVHTSSGHATEAACCQTWGIRCHSRHWSWSEHLMPAAPCPCTASHCRGYSPTHSSDLRLAGSPRWRPPKSAQWWQWWWRWGICHRAWGSAGHSSHWSLPWTLWWYGWLTAPHCFLKFQTMTYSSDFSELNYKHRRFWLNLLFLLLIRDKLLRPHWKPFRQF